MQSDTTVSFLSVNKMLQPIDRKLTLVIVKSNAEVATVQEREEQMRAQIAALSCEVSLSAIDTVVKLLVLQYIFHIHNICSL